MNTHAADSSTLPRPDRRRLRTAGRMLLTLGAMIYAGAQILATSLAAIWLLFSEDTGARVAMHYSSAGPDGPTHQGFGLTFAGWGGVAWAIALTLIVAFGAVGSCARRDALRRIALATLLASAALWLGNSVYMATATGFTMFAAAAGAHFAGLTVTAAFATRRWSRRPSPRE